MAELKNIVSDNLYKEITSPAILFLPNDTFDGDVADTITVIDAAIYAKLLVAVEQALKDNKAGVTRRSPK